MTVDELRAELDKFEGWQAVKDSAGQEVTGLTEGWGDVVMVVDR